MKKFDVYSAPGHLIRRAQQIVVSLFIDQTNNAITPVQYGFLALLAEFDGIDQVSLAGALALDTSTSASTLDRLESKGWILRRIDPEDRRRRLLSLTPEGRVVFEQFITDVENVQQRLLEPLESAERKEFMRLLTKLVRVNNDQSRVPLKLNGQPPDRLP